METINMAKLSTKSSSATHRIIIYGAPKTGKTQLAGELAEHYNLIWVDMENGHETLFKLPEAWQERIELINLPDTRSYPVAVETVLKMVKGPVNICDTHGKVSCMICKKAEAPTVDVNLPALDNNSIVVFDSLTQLSASCIAFITKSQPDDYKLNYDDWGNLSKLLDIFLSHVQQAGYNVIVISHETEAETEGKKKTLVPVGGTRNYSRNVAKFFDHVVYAERKNKKHVFSSGTTNATNILTGSRTDVELGNMDKPSLLPIFKPELYPSTTGSTAAKIVAGNTGSTGTSANSSVITKPTTVAASTKDILARLKKK